MRSDTAVNDGPGPVEVVIAAYAALSGIVLLFPARPASAPILLAAHLLLFLGCLGLPPVGGFMRSAARRWPKGAKVLRDWYPLLLIPVFYAELGVLNLIVWEG